MRLGLGQVTWDTPGTKLFKSALKECVELAPLTFLILVVEMINEAAASREGLPSVEDAPFRFDAGGVSVSLTPVSALQMVWK